MSDIGPTTYTSRSADLLYTNAKNGKIFLYIRISLRSWIFFLFCVVLHEN